MRTVVVTGAGRGVGAATARMLSEDGWAVTLVDAPAVSIAGYPLATREDLEAAAAVCPGPSLIVEADVRSAAAMAQAAQHARSELGPIEGAVAAAGVVAGGYPLWSTSESVWNGLLDVVLTGVFHLASATIPEMLAQPEPRRGRFVAVASAAAFKGLPRLGAYAAAKHGVVGLVRSLALDLRGTGVTSNAVAPGSTDTRALEVSADVYGLDSAERFAWDVPIERLITPDEVASAIRYLFSDAAGAVTGSVLAVDGGMTA